MMLLIVSRRRRSQPTLHHLQGAVPALLYGDILFTRGISKVNSLGFPDLTDLLLETVHSLCSGEILETRERGRPDWTEETYWKIIRLKTAALFQYSCRAPGILAGLPKEKIDVLGELGLNLGISFQIADDCLDFISSGLRTGKDRFADLRNRVPNLPLLLAARRPEFKELFPRLAVDSISPSTLKKIGETIGRSDLIDAALRRSRRRLNECRRLAGIINDWENIASGDFIDRYIMEQLEMIDSINNRRELI